ncbi:GNAT family N-acetyltransferase [uncultured Shimia sp.]|uniref:GNAT family N-acetyltransferase n=1 Tax=uncultured Shimia sp. TaxID=573152 RepID=UPI002620C3E3|nr:GNAT family N-acetyltransferase [uncultured Shimia sp.]
MILRPAIPKDAPVIAQIWNREICDGVSTFNSVEKPDDEVASQIAACGPAFRVAELGDQVIGFATFFPFRNGVGYAHTMEHTIYLDQSARGKGAGRALMLELEQVAKGQGVHALVAGIGGENAAAIAFHAAIGFEQVGKMPQVGRKFDRWMDLVLMQKIL